MNRTILASSIALSLGTASSAQAATISITQMEFGNLYAVTGTLNDAGTGQIQSIDPFFYQPWTATQFNWFDTHSTTLTWSNAGYTFSQSFIYTFHLTGNQVAVGVAFDWTASGVPVLIIFDCDTGGALNNCSGNSLPMATGPFPLQQPGFNGTTTMDFPISGSVVPVPASAWLLGSGLLGLVGVVRRKKLSDNI